MNAPEVFSIGRKMRGVYAKFCLPVCRKYEINQTSFDILLFLANNQDCNAARDICMLRGIKAGLVSVGVENLIRVGFLSREDDEQDRRVRRLKLTEKAEGVVAEGRAVQRSFGQALTDGIPPGNMEVLKATAEKLMQNIQKLDRGL